MGSLRIRRAGLSLWLLCIAATLSAAEPFSEDTVMAAYLVRFAGYIEWPSESNLQAENLSSTPPTGTSASSAAAKQPFTIVVLGASNVTKELLRLMPAQSIKQRPLHIRQINSIAELGDAQILFISAEHADRLKKITAVVAGKPVLVVTDDTRGIELGSTINFTHINRRIRFEVSLAAAKKNGLKISSELLSVAQRVQTAARGSALLCVANPLAQFERQCPQLGAQL